MNRARRIFLAGAGGLLLAARSRSSLAQALAPSQRRRVVVIGGGWGGLAAARHLRRLAPALDVVLIEREPAFQSLALSNHWLVGRLDGSRLQHDYAAAARAGGWQWLRAEVSGIDRERRVVLSSAGTLGYDWLVLACGIRHDYRAWFGADPAAAEATRTRYPAAFSVGLELAQLKRKLDAFSGGTLLMNLPPQPARCPPAPYERAMMIAWLLKTRKLKARLVVLDPGGGVLGFPKLFAERYREQITYVPHTTVRAVDPYRRRVSTDFDDYDFDDAILMPPQQAGDLVWQAGLIGRDAEGAPSGWGEQHPLRLHAVADERIYLVGDLIGRASPLFGHYTKSGHVAARLGAIAAAEIAARAEGREASTTLPDSVCYVSTDLDPAESLRVDASYRVRGDGLIVQSVKQHRDPQPRGEDEAWALGLYAELLGR